MYDGHEVDNADLGLSSIESVMSSVASVGSQATNGAPPRSAVLTQVHSPPPSTQSVPARAQSPSIVKSRPPSSLIHSLANPYSAGSRPQSPNLPRSHSPFRSQNYGSTFAQQHSSIHKSPPPTPVFSNRHSTRLKSFGLWITSSSGTGSRRTLTRTRRPRSVRWSRTHLASCCLSAPFHRSSTSCEKPCLVPFQRLNACRQVGWVKRE